MHPIYTRHALARLEKRKIKRAWVEQVVGNPDSIEADGVDPTLQHRLGKVPELANRVLRVIVSLDEPMRIITLYLDRNMKGRL